MTRGKGTPDVSYRRPLINPGRQLYRRPDGHVVEQSAGANEEFYLRQKGFVPLKDEPPAVVVPQGARVAQGKVVRR